jgi:hypothetical protein
MLYEGRIMMASNSNVVPFLKKSQKLAEDLMNMFGMKESIINSFNEGKVLRTNYVHYNKIFQSDATEQDLKVKKCLMEMGYLVYHILLSLDMSNKQLYVSGENPVFQFDNLFTKKCYLCVPTNLYEAAFKDGGHEGRTRQETVQNYMEHILSEAQRGFLSAFVSDDENKLTYTNIEVTVVRGNLVVIT